MLNCSSIRLRASRSYRHYNLNDDHSCYNHDTDYNHDNTYNYHDYYDYYYDDYHHNDYRSSCRCLV